MARLFRSCRWRVRTGLVGGVAILLLVDILWVGSAGLTRFLFTKESYDKPLFTTYFKTSLFSIYLVAFLFWRPWQRQCCKQAHLCVRKKEGFIKNDERQTPQNHATAEAQQKVIDHQEENDQINSPTIDDSGIFTGTVYDQFSPESHNVGVNGSQPPPSIVVSNEPECCLVSPSTTACSTDDCVCHEEQSHDRSEAASSTSNRGQSNKGREEYDVEEMSERGKLLAPVSESVCVQRKLFDVSSLPGRVNQADICPIRPKPDVCLVGPPEYEPLGCYESDDDRDRSLSTPLPPCRQKCCKVRFKPTIEVRERMGSDCRRTALRRSAGDDEPIKPLSVWKVMGVAFIFGILWFFANYLYAIGLDKTTVAAVNTISGSSGVFVMILAALPILNVTEGDKFTLTRLTVTLVSLVGAVMVSLSPSGVPGDASDKKFNYGAIFALGGAMLYALYLVLLKKIVRHHEALDIPMFFGFVGLFDFLLLLPLVLIWDLTGIEKFEFPPNSNVWTLLLVNGFVGTVLSELLWLWAVFLTSPLLGTLALSLVTPLSIAYSIVVGKASFSLLFFFGAVLIILAFIGVTVLDHYGAWDPLWIGMKKLFIMAKDTSHHRGFRSLSPESQRLITSEHPSCDHDYLVT